MTMECPKIKTEDLVTRRETLGQEYKPEAPSQRLSKKPIPMRKLDANTFCQLMGDPDTLLGPMDHDIDEDEFSRKMSEALYSAAKRSVKRNPTDQRHEILERRWLNILQSNDTKTFWKAINWKGEFDQPNADLPEPLHF